MPFATSFSSRNCGPLPARRFQVGSSGMLDLSFIRNNAELVRQAAINRGDPAPIDRLLEVDSLRRGVVQAEEALRERRNQLGKLMADPAQRSSELFDEGRRLGDEVKR